MKQIFFIITASLLTLMSAKAQESEKLIVPSNGLQRLVFGDGMKVMLVSAAKAENIASLSIETLKKLDVRFTGGTLELLPRQPLKNETVYVLVNDVRSISAGENTTVQSDDILTSPEIELYMEAGSFARLKTRGRVDAHSMAGVETTVTKTLLANPSTPSGSN